MEQPNAQAENALFYNLDTTTGPKPGDYPHDNTTTHNASLAKLNGSDPHKRSGPSIILKVMAGDTIQVTVRAFDRQQATSQTIQGFRQNRCWQDSYSLGSAGNPGRCYTWRSICAGCPDSRSGAYS